MKCPLFHLVDMGTCVPVSKKEYDCLQAECAWWDDGHPGCATLTLAQELATMRQKDELEVKHD